MWLHRLHWLLNISRDKKQTLRFPQLLRFENNMSDYAIPPDPTSIHYAVPPAPTSSHYAVPPAPTMGSDSDPCSGYTPSRIPLTTTFSPPATCTQFWTPRRLSPTSGSGSWCSVSFYRTSTHAECQPSQFVAQCTDCLSFPGRDVSPGVCPSGSVVVSTGIETGVTTHYCCPS